MSRVLIPLAPGVEELEAIAPIDILRRAGCHVVTASVGAANPIVGRNRIRVLADIDLADALLEWEEDWDLVVLPGGLKGVEMLGASTALMDLIRRRVSANQPIAAICAAPVLLVAAGIPKTTPLSCHPGVKDTIAAMSSEQALSEAGVVDFNGVITSRGAGTALEFALACVERVLGEQRRLELEREIAM